MTRVVLAALPPLLAVVAVALLTLGRWRQDAAVLLWNVGGTTRVVAVGHAEGSTFASLITDTTAGLGQRPMLFAHSGDFGPFAPEVTSWFPQPDVQLVGFQASHRELPGGGFGGGGMTAANRPPATGTETYVAAPPWAGLLPLPLTLLVIIPAYRRRRRRRQGRCLGCGYDLRGLPDDSDRCPECGRPAANRPRP